MPTSITPDFVNQVAAAAHAAGFYLVWMEVPETCEVVQPLPSQVAAYRQSTKYGWPSIYIRAKDETDLVVQLRPLPKDETSPPPKAPIDTWRLPTVFNPSPVEETAPPPNDFVVKDSGQRETFATGARRDTEGDKPKFDVLPWAWLEDLALAAEKAGSVCRLDLVPVGSLVRLACLYGRGACKYGEDNWRKGIALRRTWRSLMRHAVAWFRGKADEDHLAAVAWNAVTLMETEGMVNRQDLPANLVDCGPAFFVVTDAGIAKLDDSLNQGPASAGE